MILFEYKYIIIRSWGGRYMNGIDEEVEMKQEKRSLIILASMTLIIFLVSAIGNVTDKERVYATVEDPIDQEIVIDQNVTEINDTEVEEDEIPESLTGLLIGFDESGGLTDVMILGYLDTKTNQVKIISIPRDLYIDFRTDKYKAIKENNPDNRVLACKLNEVYSYSGWNDKALLDVKEIISIVTDINIDYMATIDIEGFMDVVDAVGGVDFYVPVKMRYYDPAADFLIDLQEGQQVLDGSKALQLVRYRNYTMGDLQRIQVQQDFMVAVYEEIKDDLNFAELIDLSKIAYEIVDTDFGLFDVLKYVEYLFDLDTANLLNPDNMMTIPTTSEKMDGIWYQHLDEKANEEMIKALLSKVPEVTTKISDQ